MTNWKEIHPDFTPESQQKWEEKGFNYEQTKEWIDAGLKANGINYTKWLRDTKKISAEWLLSHGNDEQLRKEYQEYSISRWRNKGFSDEEIASWTSVGLGLQDGGYAAWMRDIMKITPGEYPEHLGENNDDKLLREQWQIFLEERKTQKKVADKDNWKDIHPDFTLEIQKKWEEQGIAYEEVEKWIGIAGLQPKEAEFALWLKDKNINQEWIFNHRENNGNIEDLKEGYRKYLEAKDNISINAQEWLEKKYPNRQEVKHIKKEDGEIITGKLVIRDFPSLEIIDTGNEYKKQKEDRLVSLTIINCPKLIDLNCRKNELTELTINNCSNLESLLCEDNSLTRIIH